MVFTVLLRTLEGTFVPWYSACLLENHNHVIANARLRVNIVRACVCASFTQNIDIRFICWAPNPNKQRTIRRKESKTK